MLDQATRMSRLVDDLMSLSRLELRANIAPDQKVDLVPLLGHVRDALLPLAQDLDVSIKLHMPDGKVEVTGTATNWCRCSRTLSKTRANTDRTARWWMSACARMPASRSK